MYEIIKQLCQQNGTTITALCEKITGSKGNLATWKKGNIRTDYLKKISEYFNVSTDYLLNGDDNIKVYDEHDNIVVIDDETRDIIDSLRTNPEMKILFSVSKKATKEDIIKAVKIIEALRNEE